MQLLSGTLMCFISVYVLKPCRYDLADIAAMILITSDSFNGHNGS